MKPTSPQPVEGFETVTVAPTWDVSVTPAPSGRPHLSLIQPGIAPCASTTGGSGLFQGGLDMEFRARRSMEPTPTEVAKAIIVATAVAGLHEALEWVRVDGHQLADPHPWCDGQDQMWDWVGARMLRILNDYIDRYPEST